jgi:twitching motility protein PilT
MARLDPFIERLVAENAIELAFETGSGAVLKARDGGTALLIRQALSAPQIVNAIAEVVPADMRPTFPTEGEVQFGYMTGSSRVLVDFRKCGKAVSVRIVPDPQAARSTPAVRAVSNPVVRPLRLQPSTEPPAPPSTIRPVEARTFRVSNPRAAMDGLLKEMYDRGASDLHLCSDCPPSFRVDGAIRPAHELGIVQASELQSILFSIAPERNQEQFKSISDTDFAHETSRARYRVNLFSDRKGPGAVIRLIPHKILTAEELGLSQALLDLCSLPKGLVLVTGPTGSGKSTTLAALIDYANRTRDDHIITIEDPIEFVHPNKRCLINQREVGVNTGSFKHALRAALREDPDIVLVGEMRDLETVSIAIETAETGHLVFGTLHTSTAPSTVDRIIDQFPADRQAQIRAMLSESLKGVIAQTLCRKVGGGRAAAMEVMLCSGAVANLIREGKTYQLQSVMQTNRAAGMVPLNDALFDLVKRRLVEPEEALSKAVAKTELRSMLERAGLGQTPASAPIAKVGT